MVAEQESFDAWWQRLVALASDQNREKYLCTRGYHLMDWRAKLEPNEVIEYRIGQVLHKGQFDR
jgi:hypothetical protein